MTPAEISILLHYNAFTNDVWVQRGVSESGLYKTLQQFVGLDLLRDNHETSTTGTPRYSPTEKLRVYVDALCAVPLPVKVTMWSIDYPSHKRSCCKGCGAVYGLECHGDTCAYNQGLGHINTNQRDA